MDDTPEMIFGGPEGGTFARLTLLGSFMENYLDSTKSWPPTIETVLATKSRARRRDFGSDSWGRPILYTPGPPCGTLVSLGPDGPPASRDEISTRFPAALCSEDDVDGISAVGRAMLRAYVQSLIRLRDSTETTRNFRAEEAAAESLLAKVLSYRGDERDRLLAYVLFLANVGGARTGEGLVCRALDRSEEAGWWIEVYQTMRLPSIGIEPLPDGIVGDGAFPRSVLTRLRANERC